MKQFVQNRFFPKEDILNETLWLEDFIDKNAPKGCPCLLCNKTGNPIVVYICAKHYEKIPIDIRLEKFTLVVVKLHKYKFLNMNIGKLICSTKCTKSAKPYIVYNCGDHKNNECSEAVEYYKKKKNRKL